MPRSAGVEQRVLGIAALEGLGVGVAPKVDVEGDEPAVAQIARGVRIGSEQMPRQRTGSEQMRRQIRSRCAG